MVMVRGQRAAWKFVRNSRLNLLVHGLLAALDPPGAVLVQAIQGKQHHGRQHGVAPGQPGH